MSTSGKAGKEYLPDLAERERITKELDANMLVEAAAGTGKTTGLVERMLALLRIGRCESVRNLVAITFTRKAAGEIRSRFQVELERAAREAEGEERERLERALEELDQCFMGTIHSFCARLLRERPVEAGVDLDFREMDDLEDRMLREEAWDGFVSRITSHDPSELLGELRRLGMSLFDLKSAFMDYVDFPDVEEWPLPEERDLEGLCEHDREKLETYLRHMEELQTRLPDNEGNDKLIPLIRRLPRVASHHELERPEELMRVLQEFDRNVKIVQKVWERGSGLNKEYAKEEQQSWDRFREEVAAPALRAWREARYRAAMRALASAGEEYLRLRAERGCLSFQDLLINAARLLRENPHVREYFQKRFTHLLVDEFQDTDPVQAEMIFLLTSCDAGERDWRRCLPRPGSLFLVGDPKQSIYRFRRADMAIYQEAKRLLRESGGVVIPLSTNFRSLPPLIEWVNRVFGPVEDIPAEEEANRFPAGDTEAPPSYVPLQEGREGAGEGAFQGVYRLHVPKELSNKGLIIPYEADLIARFIRHALDTGLTVPRTRKELERGLTPEATPEDFMILTRYRSNIPVFAEKLRAYGVPCRVSGGAALQEVEELWLLRLCLQAVVRPEDPVALVGALRSELFGISDAALYAFKRCGGSFSFYSQVPEGLGPEQGEAFADAFLRLRRYREWLFRMPPVAAVEKMVDDLGLAALAAARPGGDMRAGGLAKAVELLRGSQAAGWSNAEMLDFMELLLAGDDQHDGMSARSGEPPAVRVMNLHKAKGLEAPVVFLADVTGETRRDVGRHIDRSGDKVRGYLCIGRRVGQFGNELLAHPSHWESISAREKYYQDMENIRLRYVAATRAGAACIVSTRESRKGDNPWHPFEPFVSDCQPLERPEVDVREPEAVPVDGGEAVRAAEELRASLERARDESYRVLAAKESALAGTKMVGAAGVEEVTPPTAPERERRRPEDETPPESPGGIGEGEHGMAWGEVVHLLLQGLAREPEGDLLPLARAALDDKGLPVSLAEEAVRTATAITRSLLWRRAQESELRLAEVPFHVPWEEEGGVPTMMRGSIDLAFREEDGWVLVDYKTDRLAGRDPREVAGLYAPQLRVYARAWEKCTGQKVKEALVCLVDASSVHRVS